MCCSSPLSFFSCFQILRHEPELTPQEEDWQGLITKHPELLTNFIESDLEIMLEIRWQTFGDDDLQLYVDRLEEIKEHFLLVAIAGEFLPNEIIPLLPDEDWAVNVFAMKRMDYCLLQKCIGHPVERQFIESWTAILLQHRGFMNPIDVKYILPTEEQCKEFWKLTINNEFKGIWWLIFQLDEWEEEYRQDKGLRNAVYDTLRWIGQNGVLGVNSVFMLKFANPRMFSLHALADFPEKEGMEIVDFFQT